MTLTETRNMSFTFSLLIHLLLLILFYFLQINLDYEQSDLVEIDFGSGGLSTSSGASGTQLTDPNIKETPPEETKTIPTKTEDKKVDLVKTKNTSDDKAVLPIEKKKEDEKKSSKELFGNKTEGEGSMGYDIDWGGYGKRKIYSYNLPEYPSGVSKEVDIRLRFSILPDGSVGTIFPLTKADTKLENAAINSLRQWRFEPLRNNQKQVEQYAIIVFPYRLS